MENDLEESIDFEAAKQVEDRIAKIRGTLENLYDTEAWRIFHDDVLVPEFARYSQTLLNASDANELMLVRERARVINELIRKPMGLRQELEELIAEWKILVGETPEEEQEDA